MQRLNAKELEMSTRLAEKEREMSESHAEAAQNVGRLEGEVLALGGERDRLQGVLEVTPHLRFMINADKVQEGSRDETF